MFVPSADKVTLITAFSVGAVAEDVMGASYMLVVLLHTVILIYRKDTDGCSCMVRANHATQSISPAGCG